MTNISFKQFIYTYNFRYINDLENPYSNDTCTIRIYLPFETLNDNDRWVEFGIYDFSNKDYTWKICEKVLSKDVLNSYIYSISYNDEINNVVTVYLTNEKNHEY